jgi:hypothetical protein
MLIIAALLVYCIGYLVSFRTFFRSTLLSATRTYERAEWSDLCFCGVITLMSACLWPGVALCVGVRHLLGDDPTVVARRIGGESKAMKNTRLKQQLAQQDCTIQSLEKRLNIS